VHEFRSRVGLFVVVVSIHIELNGVGHGACLALRKAFIVVRQLHCVGHADVRVALCKSA
jgi:hypothetical protein